MATSEEGQGSRVPGRGRQGGRSYPSPRHQPVGQDSPVYQSAGAASSGQNTELSISDASSWALNGVKNDKEGLSEFVNYTHSVQYRSIIVPIIKNI